MDMKRHLKSALKQLGFDKPRKAQIIPMNTLDAEQDAIVIAATGSGKQVCDIEKVELTLAYLVQYLINVSLRASHIDIIGRNVMLL